MPAAPTPPKVIGGHGSDFTRGAVSGRRLPAAARIASAPARALSHRLRPDLVADRRQGPDAR